MENRLAQLKYKEVVSMTDGSRFGYVGDMEVDLDSGKVTALILPGRLRLLGLLGREEDRYVPWDDVRRFGQDIILVETEPRPRLRGRQTAQKKKPKKFFKKREKILAPKGEL